MVVHDHRERGGHHTGPVPEARLTGPAPPRGPAGAQGRPSAGRWRFRISSTSGLAVSGSTMAMRLFSQSLRIFSSGMPVARRSSTAFSIWVAESNRAVRVAVMVSPPSALFQGLGDGLRRPAGQVLVHFAVHQAPRPIVQAF